MIDMHSKYANMHKSRIFYVIIYINNYVIIAINCMLSTNDRYLLVSLMSVARLKDYTYTKTDDNKCSIREFLNTSYLLQYRMYFHIQ